MNDRLQQEPQRTKKAYTKPELVQIPLRPDEAVLGFCKNTASGGPGNAGNCGSVATTCFTQGS